VCERAKCACGRFAKWQITGLTRKAKYVYWYWIMQRMADDNRMQMVLHGFKPTKSDWDRVPEEDALDELRDPLREFPYDIDFSAIKDEQVAQRNKEYRLFSEKVQRKLTNEEEAYFWSTERMNAFGGEDVLAKRCAVNGKLWTTYLHILHVQGSVDEESIKQIISQDISFARFFPTTQDIAKYNVGREEPLNEVADAQKGETSLTHLKHLHESGELKHLLSELSCKGAVVFPKELM